METMQIWKQRERLSQIRSFIQEYWVGPGNYKISDLAGTRYVKVGHAEELVQHLWNGWFPCSLERSHVG